MRLRGCVRVFVLWAPALCWAEEGPGGTGQPVNGSLPGEERPWSLGPVAFTGLVDLYFSHNFNHPAGGINALRNFDVRANQFSLNMAKLTVDHAPAPIGFRADLGFGRAFEMLHASEPADAPAVLRNIEQAYLSVKPGGWKGIQFDLGQFVTSAGAEVIETHSNWNYSRSLLFSYAVPYYHFGLRATVPVNPHVTAGVQLANGWNNVEDNNSGKTVGFTATVAAGPLSWANTYYRGPEKAYGDRGLRQLYDTALLIKPGSRTSFYLNFDYGVDRQAAGPGSRWTGVAGAARVALSSRFAVAPRVEWFNDADGFATGTVQRIKEITITGEMKMKEGLLTRLEYRRDWSNRAFFERGSLAGSHKVQDTLLLGFVAYFGAGW